MTKIIDEQTIERAKDWLANGGNLYIMEFVRDNHLVATLFFGELDREAFHAGFQFLLPFLEADEVSLWLDARFKIMPEEPSEPYKPGEIGDDPENKEVLVITHAKRGVGVEVCGLPYERDEEGNITEWDDDMFSSEQGIVSPFADSAVEGLRNEDVPIKQMLNTSDMFGLSQEEARVRADCAILKMYMRNFECMVAMGEYEDEILNEHLETSFQQDGFNMKHMTEEQTDG